MKDSSVTENARGSPKWTSAFRLRRNDQGGYNNTEQKYVSFTTIERIEPDVCARSGRYNTSRGGSNRTRSRYIPSWSRECSLSYAKRGGGEERNNGVSGMHDRTDRRTALREIALHASDGHTELCLCLSLSIVGRLPLSARPSFPGRVSGPRCPPSCPLTIVNRPPVPAYPAHPSLSVPPPSVRQAPDASRFRERPSGNACSRRTGRK